MNASVYQRLGRKLDLQIEQKVDAFTPTFLIISNLESRISNLESRISNLESRISNRLHAL